MSIECAIYSQAPPYRMRCEKCLAAGRCLEAVPSGNLAPWVKAELQRADELMELRAQLARAEKVIEVARRYGARHSWFIQQALAEYDRPSAPLDGRDK